MWITILEQKVSTKSKIVRFGGATNFWVSLADSPRKITPFPPNFKSLHSLVMGFKDGFRFFRRLFTQNRLTFFPWGWRYDGMIIWWYDDMMIWRSLPCATSVIRKACAVSPGLCCRRWLRSGGSGDPVHCSQNSSIDQGIRVSTSPKLVFKTVHRLGNLIFKTFQNRVSRCLRPQNDDFFVVSRIDWQPC